VLLKLAQEDKCRSSEGRLAGMEDEVIRKTSSYLNINVSGCDRVEMKVRGYGDIVETLLRMNGQYCKQSP